MKYTFKDMLNAEIYENSRVIFILGKYNIFNNIVSDEFRERCKEESYFNDTISISNDFDFGKKNDDTEMSSLNSVDLATFLEVVNVPSINGKWYCKVELESLTSKSKDALLKYAKEPSENGIIIVVSNDWFKYKDILKNRTLAYSKVSNILELGFPHKDIVKVLVKQLFEDKGIDIEPSAIDLFMLKMSKAYDEYESVIEDICDSHKEEKLNVKELRVYMKGIEHFTVEDFMYELVKPLSSDKTNSKKVLKMMMALQEEMGAKGLVYKLLKQIEDYTELRILINSGKIPVGIKFFHKDIVENIGGDKSKFGKLADWKLRKQVYLASQTSLRDWEYMQLILRKAIENVKIGENELELKCQKALYELCTRSILEVDRLNNIIGVDNIISKQLFNIDKLKFEEVER